MSGIWHLASGILVVLAAGGAAGDAPQGLRAGERVEVAVDAAAVKVRNDVVAALKRGDQVTIERLWGEWLWTTVEVGDEKKSGWVRVDQVRRVAPAGLPPLALRGRCT